MGTGDDTRTGGATPTATTAEGEDAGPAGASPDTADATGESSRISAPYASAARASTCVKPPLPPLWKAQEPRWPSCSPILWNSSTRPEPGDIGPTFEPMIEDDAW